MLEIERKFLVKNDAYKAKAARHSRIVQGFLNTNPERTVRVRVSGDSGYLTVKGMSNDTGTARFEWETRIKVADATDLIDLCETPILEKIRFEVPVGNHVFEVDEFMGENKGLVIAEIELKHENDVFERPQWLGEEVTGTIKYYNSQLTKNPYNAWKQ